MEPLNTFNIPKVLQLRGVLINGSTDESWKVSETETVSVTPDEIGSFLTAIELLLVKCGPPARRANKQPL